MRNYRPKKPVTTPGNREPRVEMRGNVGVEIRPAGAEKGFCGWARSLNTGGMSIWAGERLPDGVECRFRLHFTRDNVTVEGRGWVVYSDEKGMAVQFDEFSPESAGIIQRCLSRFAAPSGL